MPRIASLAALSLALAAPAFAAPYQAEIKRDDWGIAHVTGQSDADAVFGMIYAQAEDDFNRIELNYLTSLGRRAEAEGEALIFSDLRQRLWIDPADLKVQYAGSPRWLRALMQAWAAGLNQYLADHPEVKPKVITRFEPWMALSFSEGSIGGDIESVSLTRLQAFYEKRAIAVTDEKRGAAQREPSGSNGFAIAPSHSASGHALLLINPHTSFFFRSELQVTSRQGLDAYGAATWGQFFVYQGFNRHAGWMNTSSGVDNIDEFAVTVTPSANGFTYRHGQRQRSVTVKPITLAYRRPDGTMGSRTITTYATHHGPVVRADGDKWIAVALMNRPVEALQQSFLRTKAVDIASFLKVAALKANSSNNTVFADSKGGIAYFHPQFVPLRDDRFDYSKPVDGSDPATDWKGLHALSTLPQVIRPKNGWVMNVNDGPWWAAGEDSPRQAAFPRYMDAAGIDPRTAHAIRVLSASPRFTLDGLGRGGLRSLAAHVRRTAARPRCRAPRRPRSGACRSHCAAGPMGLQVEPGFHGNQPRGVLGRCAAGQGQREPPPRRSWPRWTKPWHGSPPISAHGACPGARSTASSATMRASCRLSTTRSPARRSPFTSAPMGLARGLRRRALSRDQALLRHPRQQLRRRGRIRPARQGARRDCRGRERRSSVAALQ